jgi:hypothetical protein
MGGTVNDPGNKSLRRALLSFGLDAACKEMLKRPTALREGGETAGSATNPTNGRFFPRNCTQSVAANGDLIISFAGPGYTYATGVHKVTFEASATVQYDQDFLMSGSTLYGYFRTREVSKPAVQLKVIESTLPSIVNQLTGFGENYAKQLLSERLREGFTVRRKPDSETDFRAGIVQLGTWPAVGYKVDGGLTLANDRTEVHEQQRDFIGPLEIDDTSKAIYVTTRPAARGSTSISPWATRPLRRESRFSSGSPNKTRSSASRSEAEHEVPGGSSSTTRRRCPAASPLPATSSTIGPRPSAMRWCSATTDP